MKDITLFINEQLEETKVEQPVVEEPKEEEVNEDQLNEGEIKDEKAFREYAEAKLKEVFGDEYDEDKAKEMVDGILKDHKDLVDADDWGALIGILNKGVAK